MFSHVSHWKTKKKISINWKNCREQSETFFLMFKIINDIKQLTKRVFIFSSAAFCESFEIFDISLCFLWCCCSSLWQMFTLYEMNSRDEIMTFLKEEDVEDHIMISNFHQSRLLWCSSCGLSAARLLSTFCFSFWLDTAAWVGLPSPLSLSSLPTY